MYGWANSYAAVMPAVAPAAAPGAPVVPAAPAVRVAPSVPVLGAWRGFGWLLKYRASLLSWWCPRQAIRARDAGSGHGACRPPGVCGARGALRTRSRACRAGGARRLSCGSNGSRARIAPVARAAIESPPISAAVPAALFVLAAVRAERAAPPPHQRTQQRPRRGQRQRHPQHEPRQPRQPHAAVPCSPFLLCTVAGSLSVARCAQ